MAFVSGLPMRPGEVKSYPTTISKKEPYKPQEKPRPGRYDHYLRNGSQEQARTSQLEHARRQGGDK